MTTPLIVAHRGLLNGPDKNLENTYEQIHNCLFNQFSAEIDLWYKDEKFWAGHDAPTTLFNWEIQLLFYSFKACPLFIHAKDIKTANQLLNTFSNVSSFNVFDFFMHDKDDAVLTKNGYIWTYPGKELFINSIAVLPEVCDEKYQQYVRELFLKSQIAGVCTDYALKWKKLWESRE